MNPIRHSAPKGELRLRYPGCWVWAASDDEWSQAFHDSYWSSYGKDVTLAYGFPVGWYVIRTREPKPPWPTFIDQRDPGDENPEIDDDGLITVYVSGPSEGYTAEGSRP